jgi:hypothetical protein
MAKRKTTESATTETKPNETTAPAAAEAVTVAEPAPPAATDTLPQVDAPAIEPPQAVTPSIEPIDIKPAAAEPAPAIVATAAKPGMKQYALLAASLALVAVLGALAGAAATVGFAPSAPLPAPAVHSASTAETIALKASVAQLGRELASLKSGVDAIGRTTSAQLRTFAERFDRAEKAQAEPAAKLAKISESLDRLERRVAASTRDVTGTITTVDKHPAKPPTIEGWKLVDMYAGRVVLESRTGALYEVGPGSNLPGVGKVETIKRENGRVIVVTPNGIITAAAMQPQPLQRSAPYYAPYRY